MTAAEACELVVSLTREKSLALADRDAYRLVAAAAIHHAHEMYLHDIGQQRQIDTLRDEVRRLRAEATSRLNQRMVA